MAKVLDNMSKPKPKKIHPPKPKVIVEAPAVEDPVPEPKAPEVFTAETFEDLRLNNKLHEILAEAGFVKLTSVQKYGIPALIEHRNVVLKSETGSGKTLAYLVPLLEHLSKYSLEVEKISREKGTYAVIFSPTRELCV